MHVTPAAFKEAATRALGDAQLQHALAGLQTGFVANRRRVREALPEFEALRDVGRDIRDHVLANLDAYLEIYERNATAAGATVHWAADAEEARGIISRICRDAGARLVTKGKSMVSEEIALNAHLEAQGLTVVETDLGEYIIQKRGEHPSHIVAPAIHLTKEQVEADFRRNHTHLPLDRVLSDPADLVGEARVLLRDVYPMADVGITGANFLVAETGSSIIVTNEGNGDLTQSLARVHVVIASIEKVVPTLEDVTSILRLLARSATGQEFTTYTTLSTGPKRDRDPDGPQAYHVVLVDNGRSEMLASEFREVLRCIRCAACMNHCPVYTSVGGHAYGWVYPGPIGSVLTPSFLGVRDAGALPNASTFCGRCEQVCPMKIPLTKLMRRHRVEEFEAGGQPWLARRALKAWAWLAARPGLYHFAMRIGVPLMRAGAFGRGAFRRLPLASGWTQHRDLPVPQGRTFQQQWAETQAGVPR